MAGTAGFRARSPRHGVRLGWLPAAGLALVVGACGPDLVVDGVVLKGTQWRATSVAGLPPVVGHEPTLAFEGETTTGVTGCNDYSWTYITLLGGSLNVRGLSASDRPCQDEDQALTKVEERFFASLRAAQRITIVGSRLEISTGAGRLVFERIEPSE